MSLRGLWIVKKSSGGKNNEKLLFVRHYVTVERRSKLLNSGTESSVELPEDSEFCDALLKRLGLNRNTQDFLDQYDSCCHEDCKPVYDVKVRAGNLWPVVVLEKFGLIFACLPLVDFKSQGERPPFIELTGVSMGFTVLHNIAEFLGSLSAEDMTAKLDELHCYLSLSMPFGTPLNLDPEISMTLVKNKDINWIPSYRLPAWKPVLNKAKQQMSFHIQEQIRAVLYDSATCYRNVHEIFGSISCKAELDGVPDVSLDLPSPAMDHLVVHPCVTYADSHPQTSITSSDATSQQGPGPSRKLQFQPPLNKFPLCHYSVSNMALPVRGIFQMKEVDDLSVHLSIRLKMNNNMKNNFEYFEVQIPFFNRGPALRVENVPSVGSVVLTPNQRTLVWNIGQKFPKSLEANVDATVLFGPRQALQDNSFIEDAFCKGLNAYTKLVFKCTDYTYSGCNIDQKSIKVYPSNTKFKVSVVRTLISSDYRIWNSHGDAIAAYPPPVVMPE